MCSFFLELDFSLGYFSHFREVIRLAGLPCAAQAPSLELEDRAGALERVAQSLNGACQQDGPGHP